MYTKDYVLAVCHFVMFEFFSFVRNNVIFIFQTTAFYNDENGLELAVIIDFTYIVVIKNVIRTILFFIEFFFIERQFIKRVEP